MTRRDVFQAIADPTRRQIINRLAQGSLNLNALAENFETSRPAISKHVKILSECGLVFVRQQGRERFCEPQYNQLGEVAAWIDQYRNFWTAKLDALESFLTEKEQLSKGKRKIRKNKKIRK